LRKAKIVLLHAHARPIIDAMTMRYYCLCHPELEAPVVPTISRGVVDRQMYAEQGDR